MGLKCLGIITSHRKCFSRDVPGFHFGAGDIQSQGDGNATASRSDIQDWAISFLFLRLFFHPLAQFVGLGSWNQYIGGYFEEASAKLSLANYLLYGFKIQQSL